MTSLVRHLLNLAKKQQQWQCPVWMFSENLTVCAVSTLHWAFSHKGCHGGCYRQLPARVLTLKVVAVYKCVDLPSQFLQLQTFFSCLWLSLGDLERWQFSSPCPEKESMPSSDGCMWRNFELDNFPQIFMTFQCVVSELYLCKTVAAFALLNEMLCF